MSDQIDLGARCLEHAGQLFLTRDCTNCAWRNREAELFGVSYLENTTEGNK